MPIDAETAGDGVGDAPARTPPARPSPIVEAVSRSDGMNDDEYEHDPTRDRSVSDFAEIPDADASWAASVGVRHARPVNEGASFLHLAPDVPIVSVRGAQFLHDDRHLADLPAAEADGLSEHTWNLVVHAEGEQMLLCEDGPGVYVHHRLSEGAFVYMNTMNRHAVSRSDPADLCVIAQVAGYGPDQRDEAVARIAAVLASRPAGTRR